MFKSFITNNASLKNLFISIWENHSEYLFEIYELILNNSKFISDIENFRLSSSWSNFDIQNMLTQLLPLLTSIKHIDIDIDEGFSSADRCITDLVQSQTQLLSFSICSVTQNILDAFKYCSNTLTSIEFIYCDFKKVSLFDRLRYLIQLEILRFHYCWGMTTQTFHPLN